MTTSRQHNDDDDNHSFYTAESKASEDTRQKPESRPTSPISQADSETNSKLNHMKQVTRARSTSYTWRPKVPQRMSSMSTRCKKGSAFCRPDLAAFHRRSCQLFSSLDSTLSNATQRAASPPPSTAKTVESRTSTSPSLTSSVTTQATSILDNAWQEVPTPEPIQFQRVNIVDVQQHMPLPALNFDLIFPNEDNTPKLASRRSSSQLSPRVTTTEQIFWTSPETRQDEYAKIDAAHTGFKGFMKKMLPRHWKWAHGKRRNFHMPPAVGPHYSVAEDQDSVRRYRLTASFEDDDFSQTYNEVEAAGLRVANHDVDTALPSIDSTWPLTVQLRTGNNQQPPSSPLIKILGKARSTEALVKIFGNNDEKKSYYKKRLSGQCLTGC